MEDKVWTDKEYTDAVALSFKAGIREVVNSLLQHSHLYADMCAELDRWQAKLKEWGP